MQIWQTILSSPLGSLRALSSQNGLCWLAFQESNEDLEQLPTHIARYFPQAQLENTPPPPFFTAIEPWVSAYFSGSLLPIPPLDLQGTDFSKKLWHTLPSSVPFGEVKSYGWLATHLKHSKAVRAVGRSLRENPVALIIPCHRIIGSHGSLTGYRGKLWRKEWLLKHENDGRPSLQQERPKTIPLLSYSCF